MSDDESQNEHLPAEGDEIFTENGSETVENDQTGLPPWAAAVTAQIQKVFTEQLEDQSAHGCVWRLVLVLVVDLAYGMGAFVDMPFPKDIARGSKLVHSSHKPSKTTSEPSHEELVKEMLM